MNIRRFSVIFIGIFFSITSLVNLLPKDEGPRWFDYYRASLGLDLKGGSSVLFEIDENDMLESLSTSYLSQIRSNFRKNKIYFSGLKVIKDGIQCKITNDSDISKASQVIKEMKMNHDCDRNTFIIYHSKKALNEFKRSLLVRTIEVINKRVNELGTVEPIIQPMSDNRIILQLPGVDNLDQLKSVVGQTAKLTFHLVKKQVNKNANNIPSNMMLVSNDSEHLLVEKEIGVSGEHLTQAQVSYSNMGAPCVSFSFNFTGSKMFADMTTKNIGKQIAIVLDNKLLSAPSIRSGIIGGSGVIEGKFSVTEANNLALMMRSGALPVKLNVLEEKMIGPGLGQDAIKSGSIATIIAILAIFIFIMFIYKRSSVFINASLLVNLMMLVSFLSLFSITLTLSGIAAIALTIGMAVDANILINERIKEEIASGNTILESINNGYNRAYKTIFDSNLTTLIGSFCLAFMGSGSIRGFGITLIIGILISLFTSVVFSRELLNIYIKKKKGQVGVLF